jgi:ribosomal protein S18 acetylase RimI-like enzyme
MNLRLATPADAPAIARLHLETLPAELAIHHWGAHRLFTPADRARRRQACVGGGRTTLGFVLVRTTSARCSSARCSPGDALAFILNSNPLGLARAFVAKLTSGTVTVTSAPEIVYMGVSERARGRRLGRILIYEGQKLLDDAGIRGYQLTVRADNKHALVIHQDCGFVTVRRFLKSGHEHLLMVCNVSPPPPPPPA